MLSAMGVGGTGFHIKLILSLLVAGIKVIADYETADEEVRRNGEVPYVLVRAGHLVDELFWEHHVAGSALCCPKLWRWREPTGLGWARMRFNRSNVDETLVGSYRLLTRMRELGIRAHSWV